ncbi:hypothetical protein HPC49_13585 [Pyxidicoccus fallax]|uniref:CARDB domain-containing protein n=1 Tax=Pyxidicoccus fallax TaxID=394095 RepID=A0A848LCU2_9BACT|nr:CARDB domain-containing protein [Pyxidicoccus fallax]NMO14573.1 hypothetical protein [Pyxidicoccus fallax]NPC79266.1 hypothetical protein [Pyxidicoccus fallax]
MGEPFDVTVTVCNQGTESNTPRGYLYLSPDTVISPDEPRTPGSDILLGSFPTNQLSPGQCLTHTERVQANPGIQGAYYLGALLDPLNRTPDVDRSNNARAGTRIGIGSRPDFVVSAVTGPTSAVPSTPFPASVTVCNQGTEPGTPFVELYLSADRFVIPDVPLTPASDVPLSDLSMGVLVPGQCRTETLNLQPPHVIDGPWYLGAIVDPANTVFELIDDNNTKVSTRFGVGLGPDFVVTAVTGPTSSTPGASLTAQVQVCNQGTHPGGTPVELYLTPDDILSPHVPPLPPSTDVRLGMQDTGLLEIGACKTLTFTGSPGGATGAYYLGAIVDPAGFILEINKENNTRLSSRLGIGNGPDLVVASVSGPPSVERNLLFEATIQVCNQGTAPSGSATAELFLSADATITPQDAPQGPVSISPLAPGGCQTLTVSTAYPPTVWEGNWYLGAIVDRQAVVPELLEENNARAGTLMGVGLRPDFVVASVTGPTSLPHGQPLSATVRVCNQGTQAAVTPVELYLSADPVITPRVPNLPPVDVFVGGSQTGLLAAGACENVTVEGIPLSASTGAWYLGAVADPSNAVVEFFENNNVKAGSRVGLGNRPDFVVTSVVGPSSVRLGQPYEGRFTVCNQGTTEAPPTEVELFLSRDTVISRDRQPDGTRDTPLVIIFLDDPLIPGQCQTKTVPNLRGADDLGDWYLGAIVDPPNVVMEFIEDNNVRAGTRITFN